MKKLIALLCICGIVAMACTKKVAPTTGAAEKTTSSTNSDAAKTEEKPSVPVSPTSSRFGDPNTQPKQPETSMPANATPMDQGKSLYITKCTTCHAAKVPGDYTSERWDNILRSMIPKAKLNSSEAAQVTAYIKANAK